MQVTDLGALRTAMKKTGKCARICRRYEEAWVKSVSRLTDHVLCDDWPVIFAVLVLSCRTFPKLSKASRKIVNGLVEL